MPLELRPEIMTPSLPHVARLAAVSLGWGLVGAGMMIALTPTPDAPLPAPAIAIRETITIPLTVPMVTSVEHPPALPADAISLVFVAGSRSYMKLGEVDGEAMPRHAAPRLVEDDYAFSAIAAVADADVPFAYRMWKGKRVTVDGTCTTTVTGFDVVARLTGDTGYASVEAETWTARTVLEHGTPVLAARLDGCTGAYARDASLPAVVVPLAIEDPQLARAALAKLRASDASQRAQAEWAEAGQPGTWYDAEYVETMPLVVLHPTTGDTFVSIQVRYAGGCGLPDLNVWGLYRAHADGTLSEVPAALGEITTIDKLVDVEGDGQLEVLGRPWLGTGVILGRSTGEPMQSLALQFYGCAC